VVLRAVLVVRALAARSDGERGTPLLCGLDAVPPCVRPLDAEPEVEPPDAEPPDVEEVCCGCFDFPLEPERVFLFLLLAM
jgi:hypothetical protein